MKFIDLTTKYKLTKERVSVLVSTLVTISLCAVGTAVVAASVGRHTEKELSDRNAEASSLYEAASEALESSSSASLSAEISAQISASESESYASEHTNPAPQVASTSQSSDSESSSSDGSEDEETTETAEADTSDSSASESTSETEEETTTTTTSETTAYESQYFATVYASGVVNLRTGPGTGYDIVRELSAGSTIDVVARTTDGWYRTYNGNYVLAELTTDTPPATTTTTAATTASTTAATTVAATQATEATTTTTAAPATEAPTTTTTAFTETPSGGDTSGMTYIGSCTVTFFSPYHMGDGSYNVTTATGTTCCQGRTVAADWSILPAGTTIYVANDPLGGDGYYVVEDRGSAVIGNHIDIFADDISGLSTTTRDVYIVN